jgi:hypothetical protein
VSVALPNYPDERKARDTNWPLQSGACSSDFAVVPKQLPSVAHADLALACF